MKSEFFVLIQGTRISRPRAVLAQGPRFLGATEPEFLNVYQN